MVSTEPSRKGFGDDDDMNKETWMAVATLKCVSARGRPSEPARMLTGLCFLAQVWTRRRDLRHCMVADVVHAPVRVDRPHRKRVGRGQRCVRARRSREQTSALTRGWLGRRRCCPGTCVHRLTDHAHYVQGVSWDPLGRYVATQSNDRYARRGGGGRMGVRIWARRAAPPPSPLPDPNRVTLGIDIRALGRLASTRSTRERTARSRTPPWPVSTARRRRQGRRPRRPRRPRTLRRIPHSSRCCS